MKTKIYKLTRWLCTLLLGVLGFTSCEKDKENIGDLPSAYGCPTADYLYVGVVTDQAGNPIKGIKVKLNGYRSDGKGGSIEMTTYETDSNGSYSTEISKGLTYQMQSITYTDIDGADNGGEFESQTVKLTDMDKLQLRKGEGWYNGVFKLSAEVKLKNKE